MNQSTKELMIMVDSLAAKAVEHFNGIASGDIELGSMDIESLQDLKDALDSAIMNRAIMAVKGNQSLTARILGVSRGTLRTKLGG